MTTNLLLSQVIGGFCLARLADGYSPATVDQYKWGLEKLVCFVGDKSLDSVTKEDIRKLLAGLQAGSLSSASVFHVWKSIRAFYKWAAPEFDLPRPDLEIRAPPHSYAEVVPFTQDEVKRLLAAIDRTKPSEGRKASYTMARPQAYRDKAIVFVLLDTGIRVSELSRLKTADVDLQAGMIHIAPYRSGVKSRGRSIPIGVVTRKAIWRYHAGREPNEYAFATMTGRQLQRVSILQLLTHLGNRAGVRGAHPHKFRHTFSVEFLRNGGNMFILQRLLGHSSLEMVRLYIKIAEADDVAAHQKASPVDRWRL